MGLRLVFGELSSARRLRWLRCTLVSNESRERVARVGVLEDGGGAATWRRVGPFLSARRACGSQALDEAAGS